MKTTVVIADDHAVLREGLASLVGDQPDMRVVGQATDGQEALERCRERRPDVVVLDLSMPRMNGIEAMMLLTQQCPTTQILVLSMHDDAQHLKQALEAGAAGYLAKSVAAREILNAIREVSHGHAAIHVSVASETLQRVAGQPSQDGRQHQLDVLSRRELDVFRLVAYGHTSKEIATRLELSPKSVDSYRERIGEKLALHSRAALVRLALETGVLTRAPSPADDDVHDV